MVKSIPQCPVCFDELELRNLAPCDDCGFAEAEIEHFESHEHVYSEFEVYGSTLILCNFCDLDFSSYKPEHWGFESGRRVGYGSQGFRKVTELPYSALSIKKGWFCSTCGATLKMVEAALKAREENGS